MELSIFQVDAFADKIFGGNPAAVIPLSNWLSAEMMQQLAMENNLSETVFFVPSENKDHYDYEIRWFTPEVEINLCGHATLASAFVLFNIMNFDAPVLRFHSKSGVLTVTKDNDLLSLDFPSWKPKELKEWHPDLSRALGNSHINTVHQYRDLLVELENEEMVKNCKPDFGLIKMIGEKIIITAKGSDADFVSRFFAPTAGIDEDPVTGSANSQLIPYWSAKLGRSELYAKQLSKRGGQLWCRQEGERVIISGKCVFFMKGVITI